MGVDFTVTAWTAADREGADFWAVAAGFLAGAAFGAVGDVEVRRGLWADGFNQGTHLASDCSARSSSVLVVTAIFFIAGTRALTAGTKLKPTTSTARTTSPLTLRLRRWAGARKRILTRGEEGGRCEGNCIEATRISVPHCSQTVEPGLSCTAPHFGQVRSSNRDIGWPKDIGTSRTAKVLSVDLPSAAGILDPAPQAAGQRARIEEEPGPDIGSSNTEGMHGPHVAHNLRGRIYEY